MTEARLIPGHAVLCRGCIHRTEDLMHPSPCDRLHWEGPQHFEPRLRQTAEGVHCCDFADAGGSLVSVAFAGAAMPDLA